MQRSMPIGRRAVACALATAVALLALAASASFAPAGAATELLMFEERGCPWCRRWRVEVGQAYANSPEGKRAPLRVLDIHVPRPRSIAFAAPIRATPTFVLVDGGREVGRITGYPGADFFWGMLEVLIRKLDAPTTETP